MLIKTEELAEAYDFVIVGGGTSGLVVANRLTENSGYNVLVLEAGTDHQDDPRVLIPALCLQALGTDLDWQFQTVPQKELNDRKIRQPQGRLLGGSSGINNQAFVSPSIVGIDAWEKLGNDGWGWATMEPYYRNFYSLNLPDANTQSHLGLTYITDKSKEANGPIQVSYTGVVQDPLAKAWVDTFEGLNYAMDGDPFSGRSLGGYASPSTVESSSKTRSYSATAYYAPAANRSNLSVLVGAYAEKLNLASSNDNKVATAVHFTCQGKQYVVGVQREVIVAAGTLQSPKLLELSGIGDPQILEGFGIPLAIDNPNVGENFHDHLMTGVSFEVNDDVVTGDSLMRGEPEAISLAADLYQNHKAGPMTVGGIGSHAFLSLPESQSASNKAIRELLDRFPINPEKEHQHKLLREILETPGEASGTLMMFSAQVNLHTTDFAKDWLQNLKPGNFVSLGSIQSHVFSRGSSHIASKDSSVPPIIDPRHLSDSRDLELYAHFIQYTERLARSPPLSHFIKPDGKRNHPTAYVENLDAAKEYIRGSALSTNHPVGTCSMQPREKGGVVNNKLIVYGTTNVRVVDASIMPMISRGNIQSTVYAVAERAADLIKADN